MGIAYRLAAKARGMTSPNPMVGSVLVKGGRILAKGYHKRAGLAHAESAVLDKAGAKAAGATLYVTLEPCAHFGRTPPCVDKIIRSGVKRVVIGMIDPNPLNNGRGIKILRQQGIEVRVGFMQEELSRLNESFVKYITSKMPFVTVKVAESLDGRIGTRSGDSKWITSDISRISAHRMRARFDAVMVGVNTVLRDNPRLDAWFSEKQPYKVIVDSRLSTQANANIFSGAKQVIIATLPVQAGQETDNLRILAAKAKILQAKEKSGQVNLRDMMKKLAQMEISSILVEGGGTLIGSLFDEGLVDKVIFFISPKIIGGKDAIGSVMGRGIARIEKAVRIKDLRVWRSGEDIVVEGYIK